VRIVSERCIAVDNGTRKYTLISYGEVDVILGDIAGNFARVISVPWSVCLSVCLSRSCIVLKRQKILTQFLQTTAPCFSQIMLKFGLHPQTSSSPNFAPK